MGLTGLFSAGCATTIALIAVGGIGLLLWLNGAFSGPKERPAVNLVETLQEANVALERQQYARAVELAGYAIDDHPADPNANLAYGMALAGAKKGHLSKPYLCAAKSQGVGVNLDSIDCERGLGAEAPLSPSILLAQLDPDDLLAALIVPVDEAPMPVREEGVEGSVVETVEAASKPRESRKAAPTPKPISAPPVVASAPETHRKGAPDLDELEDLSADDGIGDGGGAPSDKGGGNLFSGSAAPPSNVAPPPAPPPPPPPPPSISKRSSSKKPGASKKAGASGSLPKSTNTDIRIQVLAADGGLTESLVQATTKRYASRLNYCYEQGLDRDPGMAGSLVLVLQVDETGRVLSVTYVTPTAMDATMRQCVKTNLNRLRFTEADESTLIEIKIRFTVN